jgi:hypothetical protein
LIERVCCGLYRAQAKGNKTAKLQWQPVLRKRMNIVSRPLGSTLHEQGDIGTLNEGLSLARDG